jgi:hypothetical protein
MSVNDRKLKNALFSIITSIMLAKISLIIILTVNFIDFYIENLMTLTIVRIVRISKSIFEYNI